ncbi:MAG: hemolysin family protein [Eubacteriales bacterium]|nr:hemolysin family protein [Eubacteriales bacterium]
MDTDGLRQIIMIIILVICLVLSALFSVSGAALLSLNKLRVARMVEDNEKGARRTDKLLRDPDRLLSVIHIGNGVVNIAAAALMTALTGAGIAVGMMVLVILVFGQIIPKLTSVRGSERLAVGLSGFVRAAAVILTPVTFLLGKLTGSSSGAPGETEEVRPSVTQEEMRTIVSVGHLEGVLEGEEKDMINNVFDFGDYRVRDVMVSRTEISAIDADMSHDEIMEIINRDQYSRIPVYEDTIDNIIGILNVKDLISLRFGPGDDFNLKKHLRKPHFAYENKQVSELFHQMRSERIHMVIVLDEYGGTEGLVTIEDLIEEIVGDIEDEYDNDTIDIEIIKDDEYLVSGTVRLEDINELIGSQMVSEDFDTIAGFLIGVVARIPRSGEVIEYENFKFVIESMEQNRIDKIRIFTRLSE